MSFAKSPRIPKYRHFKPKNLAVVRIDGVGTAGTGPYSVLFQETIAAPTDYWILAEGTYRTVEAIKADTPSDLASTANGADHIILTHSAFQTQAAQLRDRIRQMEMANLGMTA